MPTDFLTLGLVNTNTQHLVNTYKKLIVKMIEKNNLNGYSQSLFNSKEDISCM